MLLGHKLRAMRASAGLNVREAGKQLDMAKATLSRIERGEQRVNVHVARSMMDVYNHYEEGLLDLVRQSRGRGWWQLFGFQDSGYVGMETEASWVWNFEVNYVPGLLQIEEYARAVFLAQLTPRSKGAIEKDLKVRMIRQERLTDPARLLELRVVVDEGALRRPVGGSEVMRDQLGHLINIATLPNVTLQVLPMAVGANVGMDGPLTVLSFPYPEILDVAYLEHAMGSIHVEKPAGVDACKLAFEHLRTQALDVDDSVALIEQLAGQR